MARRKTEDRGITKYSPPLVGDAWNYQWPVTLDYNQRGDLGISQDQDGVSMRVLLTPGQLMSLRSFTRRKPTR